HVGARRACSAGACARTCAYAGCTPHTPHCPHRPMRSGTCGRASPHTSPHRHGARRTAAVARARRGFLFRLSERKGKESASMADVAARPRTMSLREFADHLGKKPGYITELKKADRLVMDG